MFQPSTLHTDFARQAHEDRRADIRITRRSDRADRPSLLVALVRRLRHTVPQPPADYDGTATAH